MINKLFFIIFLFSLTSCSTKHSDMEMCFEKVRNRIKSDSILEKLKYSTLDNYGEFGALIHTAVTEEEESDSICSNALHKFLLENNKNSITVNNLIWFQQFQAYLKHERFNESEGRDKALKYEAKWKYHQSP